MWRFEGLVRDVLRKALLTVPGPDAARRARLVELAAITDAERLEQIEQKVRNLEGAGLRERLLDELAG